MKLFAVKTTSDMGKTYQTELVEAENYTDAYKQVYFKIDYDTIITKITGKRSNNHGRKKGCVGA